MYFRPLSQHNKNLKLLSAVTGEGRSLFPNSITIEFEGEPSALESMARRTFANLNPDLTIGTFQSLDFQVAGNFNGERLISRLTELFGLLALVLASVGLYGITTYSVARRTSEIGLRMALGANRSRVLSLVMRNALLLVSLGLALGIPLALLGGRLVSAQLYGVRTYDPLTLTAAVLILALSAALAGFIPARRAASIEPMHALRTE
jgi:ABC-type antimicrobial peptide transport system permease subunit